MARTISKAVLLAAGRGTRLGAFTAHTPKPLLEVAGKPLIAHIVEALAGCGLREIAIVTGYLAEQVEEWCGAFNRAHRETALLPIRQPQLNGTAGALLAARDFVQREQAFIFGWADILMDREFYARFLDAARTRDYDLLLAVNWMHDPWRGSAVYTTNDMRVERIVEKPPQGTSTTHWNSAGLFAATPRLLDYAASLKPSARGELELPESFAAMIADRAVVRAVELRGFWSDVGTPEDLARARKLFPGGRT